MTSLIWDFFSNSDFPSRINGGFLRTALFVERLLLHTFFRVTTATQQLLSQSSYFFRTAAFLRSSFFQKQSLFRSYYFRIASSFFLVSFAVTYCHLLSLAVIRCTTHCQFCYSLLLVVPLVVTRCATRLAFYKKSIQSIKFAKRIS